MNGNEEKENAAAMNLSPGTLRRFSGPAAKEIHVLCQPEPSEQADITQQAVSAYRMLGGLLEAEGGSLEHVVQEFVFFRDIRRDSERFLRTRSRAVGEITGGLSYNPASTWIGQPPLEAGCAIQISAFALIPHAPDDGPDSGHITMSAGPSDGSGFNGCSFLLGGQRYFHAGSIFGSPGGAFDESYSMFTAAEELLKHERMSFKDVVRTWIHLRNMEADYPEFNRARREFLHRHGIELLPASTGIEGAPLREENNLSLSFLAIRSREPLDVRTMTTPTLNEACVYGSDFSRGLRVIEGNRIALYVSGTASVDEEGRTAHVGDFEAQVDRMLLNVSVLLEKQGASFENVLSAITYLKHPSDAEAFRRILRQRGLNTFPNALVHAAVCRPDLLCEMEAVAAMPLT